MEIDPPPPTKIKRKKDCTTQIFLKCCMFPTAKPKKEKEKKKTVNGKIQ